MSVATQPKISTSAAIASLIGNCIEWYDFYIYGTASALVFNVIFFPSFDPLIGTLLAFGTFAVGAIMRPLGGVICGHYGDRIGRKSMLVWTLIGMGAATFLIGLLPSYAQAGVVAPIALIVLRCLQGIAFGGEWAGAALMAVEHAPKKRKGFFGAFPQMGSPIALFLSTGTFALLSSLPKEDFQSWGWRIPFLASAVLVIVGLVFRLRLLETPAFSEVLAKGTVAQRPIIEVLRTHFGRVVLGTGVILSTVVAFYVEAVFVVSYATQTVGMPRQSILNAVLVTAAFQLVLLPTCAAIADRIGIKRVALFGATMTAITAFPFFWLIEAGTQASAIGALCLGMIGIASQFAVLPSFVSSLFDARVRYSGLSLSYGIAAGVIGGLSPIISSSLFVWAKAPWPIAVYLVFVGLISIVAILCSPIPENAESQSKFRLDEQTA